MDTPLHADHQLDQLAGQFEEWRQRRSHPHERIPEPLWAHAVALTATLSPSRVAKQCRLRGSDLKKQISSRQGTPTAEQTPLGFIEVPPPPAPAQGNSGLEIEVSRADGTRLRLHAPAAALSLPASVQSFVEARACCN